MANRRRCLTESLDELLDVERVDTTGDGVEGHGERPHSDPSLVADVARTAERGEWVAPVDSLPDEVREVERVGHERHPREQVRQTQHDHRPWHAHDRYEVRL